MMAGIKYWDVMYDYRDNLRGQKSLGPLKMSLEMAQYVLYFEIPLFTKVLYNYLCTGDRHYVPYTLLLIS